MGPLDFFRSRLDNIRAHPFQSLMEFGAGVVGGPLAQQTAHQGFRRYNDYSINRAADQAFGRAQDLGDQASNNSFDKPLGDSRLSGDNPFDYEGPTGPNTGRGQMGPNSSDRQMVDALMGGGGGNYGGGPGYQGYSGPTMTGQQWQDRTGGYGNIVGQMLGVAPDQSPLVNSLLDPISMGPGLPGSGVLNHQQIRDKLSNEANLRAGNWGVSNFMVGGSPVIFGSRGNDMNQVAMMRRTPGY